jgi:hypothetical protein
MKRVYENHSHIHDLKFIAYNPDINVSRNLI